ncbi:hypothetical protein [Verrucomicrobium sp. BvORR034]|jgi:hypothetical protein|uniref:hypothetical protein n=1 Tax=Verrucomicrobium sp. BvORR034 TaxID=1396418 RepID=UPI00067953B2|nr:hypothetical protein [Verrucomicrobium sp. BvORR034]
MKKFFRLLGALTASLFLASCFELSSVVTVNKDGSGVVEETTLVSAQLKAMMAAGAGAQGGEGGPKMDILPTKEKAGEKAAKLGDGVTLKAYEEIKSPDGREGVKLTYAFTDVRKLKYAPGDVKDGEKSITFGLEGDTLTVNLPQDKPKEADPNAPKPEVPKDLEAQMAMMKPMFAGMRFHFAFKSASGIASTDATHVSGDTVTLMEMNMDKLLEKPEGFKKFAELMDKKDMTPQQAAEEFKGFDGIKIEGKEKLTIKLK